MTVGNDTPNRRVTKSTVGQTRQVKVKETYHDYQLHQNSLTRTPIGEIQLKGNWLIKAGFPINAPVTIRVMEGCLVLTADNPTP